MQQSEQHGKRCSGLGTQHDGWGKKSKYLFVHHFLCHAFVRFSKTFIWTAKPTTKFFMQAALLCTYIYSIELKSKYKNLITI